MENKENTMPTNSISETLNDRKNKIIPKKPKRFSKAINDIPYKVLNVYIQRIIQNEK